MTRTRLAVIFILISLLEGCALFPILPRRHRGDFTVVSTHPLSEALEPLSASQVSGKSCFSPIGLYTSQEVIQSAVEDALSDAPDADLLIDVTLRDDGLCVHVKGTPAKRK
jgi:hypothetical protein